MFRHFFRLVYKNSISGIVRKIDGWLREKLFEGFPFSIFIKCHSYRSVQLTNRISLPRVDPQLVRSALNRELK